MFIHFQLKVGSYLPDPQGDIKDKLGLNLPSGLKLDMIKTDTKLISLQKRRMEAGFKKNLPFTEINEVDYG